MSYATRKETRKTKNQHGRGLRGPGLRNIYVSPFRPRERGSLEQGAENARENRLGPHLPRIFRFSFRGTADSRVLADN